MKLQIKLIWLFGSVLLINCTNKNLQTSNNKSDSIKASTQKVSSNNFTKELNKSGERPTTSEIYSDIENRRDANLKLIDSSATKIKYYNEDIGENKKKIIFYYQQGRIISVVQRIYNSKNEKMSHKIYNFNVENSCILYSNMENRKEGDRTYAMFKGFLVVVDSNLSPVIIEEPERHQIIQSARLSIDSIMQHFPEFKYSFNWK